MIPISKPYIGEEEKAAVAAVLESGMLAQGPRVAELEQRFSELCQSKHAIATASGTAALHVALLAHNIGPGDEVITTPFTFIASVNSILYVGARAVLVDIDEETFNIDPSLIEAAITPRTKAIMPVHLYGYPCDMDPILAIAERHNLVIIEDAAQAVGAKYKGRPAGGFQTGCFSLYATKNIMTGEGGIITTSDDGVAERARMIRSHGMKRRYYHDMMGYNLRMSDLHAAIGVVQMGRLEGFTATRRKNAAFLSANLKTVKVPTVKDGYEHVWHQYTVRVDGDAAERDAAVQQLNAAGVGTGVFYPIPAHQQNHLKSMGYNELRMPVAERLSQQVFSLPVHPLLTQTDLEKIAYEVNRL
ncbi:MAG: DegT/DnrJ/EryC1/StrS family aminotransferase [Anaerolineae bacterium]|jgi:dTDP-4-amino-4,6-dideoxygalactose transaminase